MTIKELKEKYKNYRFVSSERNCFVVYNYKDGNGKILIIVNKHKNRYIGGYVTQAIRVDDGKELIEDGWYRPCDNLDDAIDVACEMMKE